MSLQVWQQRLECEESERLQLQTQFDQTVASMQQSAAATTLLLQKHAGTMMTSALDLEASGKHFYFSSGADCIGQVLQHWGFRYIHLTSAACSGIIAAEACSQAVHWLSLRMSDMGLQP